MPTEDLAKLALGLYSIKWKKKKTNDFCGFCLIFNIKNDNFYSLDAIYTSEKNGNDEIGQGTESAPFKTIIQAMRHAGKEPFPTIYVDAKDEKSKSPFEAAAKSQLKKIQKIWQREANKNADKSKREENDAKKRESNMEEARKIVIAENPSWPAAKAIKIRDGVTNRNVRVKIYGWIHRLRRQGKSLIFVTLRDGTGFLQCVLTDLLCQTYDALNLSTESAVQLYGTISEIPAGKTAPDNHELKVDYYKVIGFAPAGGADTILNEDSHPDVQLDNRHILIRGEQASKVLKMRSVVLHAFRSHYYDRGYNEITPPTLVQTQVEGGATLFKLKYFEYVSNENDFKLKVFFFFIFSF